MTKIDVFSGFLGAGKTTLIKKLIKEAYAGEKLVLIENEFGEIGIDGGFLKEAGIQITEMNSGCICCSLVGDFSKALRQVITQFSPDRVFIEPSGVGKLSDVIRAARDACPDISEIGALVTVIDAGKCRIYAKNFGEFFLDQLRHAGTVVLSRTDGISPEKLAAATEIVKANNPDATLITTPWNEISGEAIRAAMEKKNTLEEALARLMAEVDDDEEECDDPACACHHHHHDDEDDDGEAHEHHHHHHEDGECDDPACECHHHHHDADGDGQGHEHHHHHHHHHADDVFTSWGVETGKKFTREAIAAALAALDTGDYGTVLRAKGIVPATDGTWIHFDHVPGEADVRTGGADVTGRLCVIGAKLDTDALKNLFGV